MPRLRGHRRGAGRPTRRVELRRHAPVAPTEPTLPGILLAGVRVLTAAQGGLSAIVGRRRGIRGFSDPQFLHARRPASSASSPSSSRSGILLAPAGCPARSRGRSNLPRRRLSSCSATASRRSSPRRTGRWRAGCGVVGIIGVTALELAVALGGPSRASPQLGHLRGGGRAPVPLVSRAAIPAAIGVAGVLGWLLGQGRPLNPRIIEASGLPASMPYRRWVTPSVR